MDGNWCRAEAQPSLPSPTCFGTRGEPRDLCQLLEPEWLTRFFGMNRLTDLAFSEGVFVSMVLVIIAYLMIDYLAFHLSGKALTV